MDQGDHAELTPRAGTDEAEILRDLVERGVAVRSFTTARTSLEEIFIRVYGEQNEPAGV
jgi:ABC-2 type transport system ATP-binding protein